jgi:hypothetical protein
MTHYYVDRSPQANGDHEVHSSDCPRLPSEENRLDLGSFKNCHGAVREASKYYSQVNGCQHCSKECHTR